MVLVTVSLKSARCMHILGMVGGDRSASTDC